ncbi:MAG: hypothetical protein MJ041_05580, partial [Acidaminococcaceae bacterium]|nr:hypothetical protein [Acidaminococcaceae bacterium]
LTSEAHLKIEKTVTKYGSFAYTFEQLREDSPELKITAEPSELTLIEVINGGSMGGVTPDGEYLSLGTGAGGEEISKPAVTAKQTKMARQGASFNTYSFDADSTLATPYRVYQALQGAGLSYDTASAFVGAKLADNPNAVNEAMAKVSQGTYGESGGTEYLALAEAAIMVKTKATIDSILKDIDKNYTLMQDYVVYNGTIKTTTPRWDGDLTSLTTGSYFQNLTDGTNHINVIDILQAYDDRITESGLGTLTASKAGGTRESRILTLNGNGFNLEGGQIVNTMLAQAADPAAGIQDGNYGVSLTKSRDELHIINVGMVSGFKEYVVNNQGSLYLQDTPNLLLNANVIDKVTETETDKHGITYINNSKLNIGKGYRIEQLRIEIDNLSEVTAHATGLIAGSMQNLGTINMYGGEYDGEGVSTGTVELKANISGTGLLHITKDPVSGGSGANIKADTATVIANKILIDNGSEFEISANALMGENVQNFGVLTLDEGILGTTVTDGTATSSGTTVINGDIYVNNDVTITQKAMTVNGEGLEGKTLPVQADHLNIGTDIKNNGNLQLMG